MKILIGCEYSGVVRDSFIAQGHEAISCDVIPTEARGPHINGDLLEELDKDWDMLIAFPPCTYLTKANSRNWSGQKHEEAVEFFLQLYNCQIPKIALENPVGVLSTRFRKPDCIVQPWWFGHPEVKTTCFWLKNLPPLLATEMGQGRDNRLANMGERKDRGKLRSRTYKGIAEAMAIQWGNY